MELFTLNLSSSGPARRVTLNGVEYLVSPITLLVPGVLPGSKGSLFYPEDEVAKSFRLWNGMPLTLRHPTANDGRPVIARHPGVLDRVGLGHVKNAKIRLSDKALVGEGWFDEQRVLRTDKWLHNALVSGIPVEVSTGLFTDNSPAPPSARCPRTGRGYQHVARNYRPDHLAILPDQAGACSLRDGCGLNVNAQMTLNCHGKGGKPGPCPTTPNYGSASRAGKPAAVPEGGHWVPGSTLKPATVGVTGKSVKNPSKLKIEDHLEAGKIEAELHAQHKERVKGNTDPGVHSDSYERYKTELKARGVVGTDTGYGFAGNKLPTTLNADTGRDNQGQFAGGSGQPATPQAPAASAPISSSVSSKTTPKRVIASKAGSAEAATRAQQQADAIRPPKSVVPAVAVPARNTMSPTERMALLVNVLDRLSPQKACQIIKDGSIRGKKLTKAQRGYFGAKCGERDKPVMNAVVRNPLDVLSEVLD